MGKDERFVKIYSQGKLSLSEIFVDKVTGVNYLFRKDGYGAGLCVLVDKDGKPVVSSPAEIEALKK
ncbi:DUF6440 family protein [Ruminococcus flavefaciens]|uniref:DUF6440 domain-containing protein n=1 Tax=Ruminococcus flavefaciens TaxID=1265 RepID=A0A1H6J2V3_RUMFL|nr:DUF6440 family protein [Ruminococcus flavefaciens]SEH56388.1 hypothetical protein SAMN02910265_01475 [Ruminococcus flavefaciens]